MKQTIFSLLLCLALATRPAMAQKSAADAPTAVAPTIFADVPDIDIIRVGRAYYMVSTTMHLMPGAPIMRSTDLVNWEIISYLFDEMKDSPLYDLEGGDVYTKGQWASSIRHHRGRFYVFFATNDPGRSYIYTAVDPAGKWQRLAELDTIYHDASMLFDDDGRVYLAYGGEEIRLAELKADLSGIRADGLHTTAIVGREHGYPGLFEGTHLYKLNGKYYMFIIWWPKNGIRTQLCFRADRIEGPYESKVILTDDLGNPGRGVAQGGVVDSPDGTWHAFLFQDFGAVGRTPVMMECRWKDGWPVPGKPLPGASGLVTGDDFASPTLALNWQWNHNPDNALWSLAERPGYLRLRTGKVVGNVYEARNTLSQRAEGPACTAELTMDVSNMKEGDVAGLSAFNGEPGAIAVVMENNRRYLVMTGSGDEKARVALEEDVVHLRVDCDFNVGVDKARFWYSTGRARWQALGPDFRMGYYTRPYHFMGIRLAIFNYATRAPGGYVDVDEFRYRVTSL